VSFEARQARWAEALAAALREQGVDEVVISPGSRSTPLVLALARRGELPLRVVLDERSAAFFALGRARITERPTALVCTSGTAGTHYFPAIAEAARARLPLIAITADRPPELHERDAPQTMSQGQLFGPHVRLSLDLGAAPPDDRGLDTGGAGIARAVLASLATEPGPVHVNVAFRKPLEPPAGPRQPPAPAPCSTGRSFPARLEPDAGAIDELAARVDACRRGLLVCGPGPLSQTALRAPAEALAREAGLPLVAEASSQLRLTGPRPGVPRLDGFEALLRCGWLQVQRPDLVLQIGAHPTSSRWPELWDRLEGGRHVVAAWGWQDPHGGVGLRVLGRPGAVLEGLRERLTSGAGRREWVEQLTAADRAAREEMAALSGEGAPWSEARALGAALEALPDGALLQLSNSLPVREADAFCDGSLADAGVLHQRGVMGIDGMIAAAAGAACASGRPLLAVVGDVALAHDAGSLALLKQVSSPLVLLVLDNGGGRLFEALPIGGRADLAEPFDRYFLTPPELDPVAVARGYGVDAAEAREGAELRARIAAGLAESGARVVVARLPGPGPEALQQELARRVGLRVGTA
jgi:2-succinyl-5-enolpyruvyl-6-hydroxy-3-cyclohexene-1-carboxylate synthase